MHCSIASGANPSWMFRRKAPSALKSLYQARVGVLGTQSTLTFTRRTLSSIKVDPAPPGSTISYTFTIERLVLTAPIKSVVPENPAADGEHRSPVVGHGYVACRLVIPRPAPNHPE
jgi:hypothetical protein